MISLGQKVVTSRGLYYCLVCELSVKPPTLSWERFYWKKILAKVKEHVYTLELKEYIKFAWDKIFVQTSHNIAIDAGVELWRGSYTKSLSTLNWEEFTFCGLIKRIVFVFTDSLIGRIVFVFTDSLIGRIVIVFTDNEETQYPDNDITQDFSSTQAEEAECGCQVRQQEWQVRPGTIEHGYLNNTCSLYCSNNWVKSLAEIIRQSVLPVMIHSSLFFSKLDTFIKLMKLVVYKMKLVVYEFNNLFSQKCLCSRNGFSSWQSDQEILGSNPSFVKM